MGFNLPRSGLVQQALRVGRRPSGTLRCRHRLIASHSRAAFEGSGRANTNCLLNAPFHLSWAQPVDLLRARSTKIGGNTP